MASTTYADLARGTGLPLADLVARVTATPTITKTYDRALGSWRDEPLRDPETQQPLYELKVSRRMRLYGVTELASLRVYVQEVGPGIELDDLVLLQGASSSPRKNGDPGLSAVSVERVEGNDIAEDVSDLFELS